MKTITFLFTFLITTLGFSQNLIVNGDFETGTTGGAGWNEGLAGQAYSYGTGVVQTGETLGTYTFPATHGGTYSGYKKLWGEGTAIVQPVNVVAGETYIFQFWYYHSVGTVNVSAKIREFNGDSNGSFIALIPIVADGGANASNATNYGCKAGTWTEAKFSFTVPSGITIVKFQLWNSGAPAYSFIDDVSMELDATMSLTDLQKFNFNAYPNPAKDVLKLSATESIDKIEIYSLLGQQVLKQNVNNNTAEINISDLSKGIYLVKTYIDKTVGSYKFIKE